MKNSPIIRSKHAQNRIDYIVYGNPKGVKKLVYDYGYVPPKNSNRLAQTTKKLIRKEGRQVIKDLLKIHPDKQAIQQANKSKQDNFCGSCSSYSYQPETNFCSVCGHSSYDGNKQAFITQIAGKNLVELEAFYKNQLAKSNTNKDDSNLAEEVQIIWNQLRLKKAEHKEKASPKEEKTSLINSKEGLIILGTLVFIAGILVGSSSSGKAIVND